jgi:TctA family transporter
VVIILWFLFVFLFLTKMGREKMKSHSRRFTDGLALLGGLLVVLLLCGSFAVAQELREDEQPKTQTKNELAIYVPNPFREKTPLNPLDLILYPQPPFLHYFLYQSFFI